MDLNDTASLALLGLVLVGAIVLKSRIGADGDRMSGWWIGVLHGLFAVLTLRASVLAHDVAFHWAMLSFTVYALGMTVAEAMILLKSPAESPARP